MSGWLYSISTQYPAGTLLRQTSWLYMFAVTVPAVLLAMRIPKDSGRPSKEGYEAVPMLDTSAEASARDEGDRGGTRRKVLDV